MKKFTLPESINLPAKATPFSPECCFDDACILDMDCFVKTLASIKAKRVRPDLIGSIIAHYAPKWLPELCDDNEPKRGERALAMSKESPSGSIMASWMKKRFFVETLVGVLPPEKDSIPCNFLLRLLRMANMIGIEPAYRTQLEKRISWRLDEASLKELMIPSFCHTCGTLLDVELVIRLVKRFVNLDEALRSGAALAKVAKLVDRYLAEAAVDSNLMLPEFVDLAGAFPSHARALDDGLYRAIDTFLKVHPLVTKPERKTLCRLIDSRKLSPEASLHAAQNERLPVRAVIQVLFSEQLKLSSHIEWSSGSFSGLLRSPSSVGLLEQLPGRTLSKREALAQQLEIKKLKEDVIRLQRQCSAMQGQIEKLLEKKRGFLWWRKLGISTLKGFGLSEKVAEVEEGEAWVFGQQTPVDMKTKLVRGRQTPKKWRKSM